MITKVKICGITNEADALTAIEAGADALGFIFYSKSPRFIDAQAAQSWMSALPPFVVRVGVVVNETRERLREYQWMGIVDVVQFHGDETIDFVRAIDSIRKIKALRMSREFSPSEVRDYDVNAFLLDTPAESYGGSGRTFDWELAVKFRDRIDRPIVLSGGLTADNVAQAIAEVRPYAVDVSSGVEAIPGKKDAAKVRDFIQACKS